MTAEEIRALIGDGTDSYLREIAAQLAELNGQISSVTLKKELTEFVEAFRFARLLLGQDEGKKQ
jgi:hypothetical protein